MNSNNSDKTHKPAEEYESIWILTVAPLIWMAHFLASYLTAAIWCAKYATADESAGEVRLAVFVYTAVAVPLIVYVGRHGLRRHQFGDTQRPHDFDTSEDRYRFLGFATLLLSCLSAVATIFTALVLVFVGSCH